VGTGADLGADVLKIPHHGSAQQDPAFFAATHARLAIASAGAHNDYGHPAPRTVQLVESLGMTLLRTDQNGSVAIRPGTNRLAAVTQR
jgi:competence protein ComEC